MNREIAEKVIALAKASKAEFWIRREPSPEMKARFGELPPIVELPRQQGEPCGITVLAQDYGDRDQLREDHINFVVLVARHAEELATYWLDHIEFSEAPCGHSSQYCHTEDGGKTITCLLCEHEEAYHQGIERDLNT